MKRKPLKLILAVTLTASIALAGSGNSSGIDSSKILNWLGEGDNSAVLTLTWGDDLALDNLASGVKFSGEVSVDELLSIALKNDPRFYSLRKDGEFAAFGFDTNGDNSAAVTLDGDKLTLTDGCADTTTEDISGASGSSQYDHWKINDSENEWAVYVNGVKADLKNTIVSGGDEVSLRYIAVAETEPAGLPYTFFLHPASEQGIWMLEECVINTENGKQANFPMIANILDDTYNLYGVGVSAEVYKLDGETSTTDYSAYVTNGSKGAMSCRVSVIKPVEALVRPFINIRKDWGSGSKEVRRVYGGVDSHISTVVAKPLTDIRLEGYEPGDVIEIENMGVNILKPVYEPEDADFIGYEPEFGDTSIATLYSSVNAVVAHCAGETTMTIKDASGNAYGSYTIRVKDVNPNDKPDDDFQDGLVFLNEEWYTHTSGSLNYIDATGKIYYRAYANQNNNMAFGATSQFGITYADKYIIMSKQEWDGGDTRPLRSGGRVVVFDARTFKHIGAIDEIGGDGRSAVGVNPSKVYLGTTQGIRVMDLDNITIADEDIAGITIKRYTGMIGNMVKAGKYVFAANIGTGLEIIDTETDKLVKSVDISGIQGVVQSKDGRVWIGCSNTLQAINPETLELEDVTYHIPGLIGCSSSTWRSVNLMSSTKENVLLWGKSTYNGNDGELYRWNLDEVSDPSTLEPIFKRDSEFNAAFGYGYGSPAYDDRTDTYIFATVPGFGNAALKTWYHFVDASTGEIKKTIRLTDYWWFPAMPIVPDKYDVEINLDDITVYHKGQPLEIDLSELVSDVDNHDCNIKLYIDSAVALSDSDDDDVEEGPAASVTLEGRKLTVTPLHTGTHYFTLTAESNGRAVSKELSVEVKKEIHDGVNGILTGNSDQYKVYDMSGIYFGTYNGSISQITARNSNLTPGTYLLVDVNGNSQKVIIK